MRLSRHYCLIFLLGHCRDKIFIVATNVLLISQVLFSIFVETKFEMSQQSSFALYLVLCRDNFLKCRDNLQLSSQGFFSIFVTTKFGLL